ncbi:DUF839 domain-containing protein [Vibrio lentus]|nr:DUF839 domain-containing protein [Vibrio lentus]
MAGNAEERLDEFTRFNIEPTGTSSIDDYRNETNGHGYIVEIDPYTENARAKKRTALGRFRHEGCTFGKLEEGQPVVSSTQATTLVLSTCTNSNRLSLGISRCNPSNRLATGDKYMDEGTLYVARFNEASGTWLPLTLDSVTLSGGVPGG